MMPADFTNPLWLLKLGALVNLYFLANVGAFPARRRRTQQPSVNPHAYSGEFGSGWIGVS
jgi:hypothetical protein